VRCLARRPEALAGRVAAGSGIVAGDLLDPSTLAPAFRGVETAYYLIHSMGTSGAFEEEDRRAATNFAEAARVAGCRRIVYLGGLGDPESSLSRHLRSRQEVGEILRGSGVQVLEFRASIVLGSGSLSYEMIRALVERLPVMITPRWVRTKAQPIGITDLLAYLVAAAGVAIDGSPIMAIGGADAVSYGEIMREYARQRGLRRAMISVPVLTPRLSSLWLGLVTPLYARVGRRMIDSLRNPTIVEDDTAGRLFPIRPAGFREAIAAAIRNEDEEFARTRWSDALSSGGTKASSPTARFGTRLVDSRTATVAVPPAVAFAPVRRIGGTTGWYYADPLWRLRGFLDLLAGGVGLRRGRRDPENLGVGETVDFWRVEAIEPGRRLRLAAEMKLPGRAWLEFEVQGDASSSTIRQTAIFDPLGLAGLAYWYALYPMHAVIFGGMLRRIARAASSDASGGSSR